MLALRLHRVPELRAQGRWLGGLALLQLATGLGNVLLGWPLAAAVLHTGGAAALAVVLTWTLCESRRAIVREVAARPEAPTPTLPRRGREQRGMSRRAAPKANTAARSAEVAQ